MRFRLVPEQLVAELAQYIQAIPSGSMPVKIPVRLLAQLQNAEAVERAPSKATVAAVKGAMEQTEQAVAEATEPIDKSTTSTELGVVAPPGESEVA